MQKIKTLELFDGLRVKVHSNGKIETLDHCSIRKNGRLDNRKGRILKPKIDKYGYEAITLSHNGIRKCYTVHRLVAMAFLPNTDGKPTVNHKNGIKTDNSVENLEWASQKEQKFHSMKNHLCDKNINALKKSNELSSIRIIYEGKEYNSIREASRILGIKWEKIKRDGVVIDEQH